MSTITALAPTKTLEPTFVNPQLVLAGEKKELSPTRESWLIIDPGQKTLPAPMTQNASIRLPAMTTFAGPISTAGLTVALGWIKFGIETPSEISLCRTVSRAPRSE